MRLIFSKFFKAQITLGLLLGMLIVVQAPKASPSAQVFLYVPQDYPTIQAAVDAAPEGATILIGAPLRGVYFEEAVIISKSVTLRAQAFTAFIRGPDPLTVPKPVEGVINIVSDVPIQVALEDLNISQGELHNGIWVNGPAHVTLKKVYVSYYYDGGLLVEGSAHVILRDSIVSGFFGIGVEVRSAVVELINSQVAGTKENIAGLSVGGASQVSLQNSTVSGHGWGISAYGPSRVTLQDSIVVGNGIGISTSENIITEQPAMVTVKNSQISSNRYGGLNNRGGIVELQDSFVMGNGVDPKCHQLPLACGSGIILHNSKAQLKLRSTEIRNNATWGVAAYLPQCGAPSYVPPFPFKVTFEDDKNVIENNNRSGVLNGMGNPGNHPFKNLPDGQVCLP